MLDPTSDPSTCASKRPLRPAARSGNRLSRLTAILLFFIPAALLPQLTIGTVATSTEMEQVCRNWVAQKVYQQGSWAGDTNPQIVRSNDIFSGDTLLARWYDISPKGYVLVPVLKEMQPVKAYSDEYNLDENQEGGFLALVREMLSTRVSLYARQFGSMEADQATAAEPVFGKGQRKEWDRLAVDAKAFGESLTNSLSTMSSAGPLLTTSWHQRAPYNNLCPMGDGDRTVVGCVATAIAQILNYWHWPENGYGSHTYTWGGDYSCDGSTPSQQLSADFSDPYDWANMTDSCDEGCTSPQEDAVAELNYEAGVAVNMDYGACGSGSYLDAAVSAFSTFFKYSNGMFVLYRQDYDLSTWFYIIKAQIDQGRVCDYFITRHSIVVDGWRDDGGIYQYHMNYGWGGPFTTWFVLDSLYCYWEPDSLCPSSYDAVVINIRPETEPFLSCAGVLVSEANGNGNGLLEPGETMLVSPIVRNMGAAAQNVTATTSTSDADIEKYGLWPALPVPDLAWGEQATTTTAMDYEIFPTCPDPHVVVFRVDLAIGTGFLTTDTFQVFVGTTTGFSDDVEDGQGNWRFSLPDTLHVNQWHIDTFRKHSGTSSWKAGGLGGENYLDKSDVRLVSPPFLLPDSATLTFWHWIAAEQGEEPGTAWDGANVYISSGDGQWTLITPNGGYPYTIIQNLQSPYDPGTPCYSGTHDWTQAVFDLSAYSGVVQIMFRLGSDGYTTYEGWYIDDIDVTGKSCCGTYTGGYTGNANCDPEGTMNLQDVTRLIDRIYLSKQPLCCDENGNVNGDSEGTLNLQDVTALIDHIYLSKNPTAQCQ